MSGLDISIPFTGDPDATLPYAGDFDMLETPGSLVLLEPSHSANPLIGTPGLGGVVPNILWRQLSDARVAGGLAAATEANSRFTRITSGDVANILFTERSGKGGLHGIITKSAMTSNNQSLILSGGTDLTTYFNTFPTHNYYVSLWERVTRAATSGAGSELQIVTGFNTSNFIENVDFNTPPRPNGGSLTSPTTPGLVTGNQFRAGATGGTVTGTPNNNYFYPFIVGCAGPYSNSGLTGFANRSASRILYRCYIEDLTVSGRSFATVSMLDKALYDDAFASTGRYFGDTFSDPLTAVTP